MKRHLLAVSLIGLLAACGARQTSLDDRGAALVIVNINNPAPPDLGQLRDFFLGRRLEWDGGLAAVVVDLIGRAPQRAAFLDRVVGLDANTYDRTVIRQVYSTSWRGPHRVADDAEVLRVVSGIKGAIGVIAPGSLTDAARSKVRVLLRL